MSMKRMSITSKFTVYEKNLIGIYIKRDRNGTVIDQTSEKVSFFKKANRTSAPASNLLPEPKNRSQTIQEKSRISSTIAATSCSHHSGRKTEDCDFAINSPVRERSEYEDSIESEEESDSDDCADEYLL